MSDRLKPAWGIALALALAGSPLAGCDDEPGDTVGHDLHEDIERPRPDAGSTDAWTPPWEHDAWTPPERDAEVEIDAEVDIDAEIEADAEVDLDAALDGRVDDAEVDIDAAPDAAPDMEIDAWVSPAVCDEPAIFPAQARVEVETARRFAEAGAAFDPAGRLAVVDAEGDLYRLDEAGRMQPWAQGVARTPRGLAFLPTGELIVADSDRGMLLRVYPAGEIRVLADDLDAPFGVEVDQGGFVYVSEATRGAISRVDPSSGDVERLIDGLPFSPAALAFSPEEEILYVASRRGGVLYAMARDAEGVWGAPEALTQLPGGSGEGPGFCGDGNRNAGEECDDGNEDEDDGCTFDCRFDPYNGLIDAEGGVYPLEFDEAGRGGVIFTTDAAGDTDEFSFTLDEPSAVLIYTHDLSGQACSGDTVLTLYQAGSENPYAQNDDDPLRAQQPGRLCSRLGPDQNPEVSNLPAGDYTISIRQYSPQQTELEGNWIVVERIGGALTLGDACDPQGFSRCPDEGYCGQGEEGFICVPHVCGDGLVGGDEQCDDGDEDDEDGCTSGCRFEPYNGAVDAEGGVYPLELGEAGRAGVIFTTDAPGDVDTFSFTLTEPGVVLIYTRDLPATGCSGDTTLALYQAGVQAPYAEDDNGGQDRCSRLDPGVDPEMSNLPAGDYLVTTAQRDPRGTELEGNWVFVEVLGAPLEVGDACDPQGARCPDDAYCGEDEGGFVCRAHVCGDGEVGGVERCDDGNEIEDDGCDSSCELSPYNGPIDAEGGVYPLEFDEAGWAGVIYLTDTPGDTDEFSFTLEAPSAVRVYTRDLPGPGCSGDTVLSLYAQDTGALYAENDDDPARLRRLCSRLDPEYEPSMGALPAGDYLISMRQFSRQTTELEGNWLIVERLEGQEPLRIGDDCDPADPSAPCPVDAYCGDAERVCLAHVCGDAVMGPGEACDDGNTEPGDGCDEACALEARLIEGSGLYVGQLEAGAVERFEIQLEAPHELTARLALGEGCAFGADVILTLQRFEGGGFVDVRRADQGFVDECEALTYTIEAGRWRLIVSSFQGEAVPSFDLDVELTPVEAPPLPAPLPGQKATGACVNSEEGDECLREGLGAGACAADLLGFLHCQGPEGCEDALAMACETPEGAAGLCASSGAARYCRLLDPCRDLEEGAACALPGEVEGACLPFNDALRCIDTSLCSAPQQPCDLDGEAGLCVDLEGALVCAPAPPCVVGDPCEEGGREGICVSVDGGATCYIDDACVGAEEGDACESVRARSEGRCEARPGGEGATRLVCQPDPACLGAAEEDPCFIAGRRGICRISESGVTYCEAPVLGAGIGALETDACGNVYLAHATSGEIWRVDPAAEDPTPARFSNLGRGGLTGLRFGPGVGGREAQRLYVSARGGAELLSVEVGAPGRPRPRPLSDDVAPDTPEDDRVTRCLAQPTAPLGIRELSRPRGYHDVACDEFGFIIGFDGTALVQVNAEDQLRPYASGLSGVESMDWLPDGSLVVASDQGLVRILPNGAQDVLRADIQAYGVTVGPDGRVYAGDNVHGLWRVDPETYEAEMFVDTSGLEDAFGPRNIAFDLDASLMYIVSFGENIYTLSLDEELEPIGAPRFFAKVRDNARWLDGIALDMCGDMYVPNYESSALYKISPDGRLALFHQWTYEQYGHNVEWGSGEGGWRKDALYMPQPYDNSTVVEVLIGVTGYDP